MADTKITELTSLLVPSDDDLLLIVDEPSGSPVNKKITFGNFLKLKGASFTMTGGFSVLNVTTTHIPIHDVIVNDFVVWTGTMSVALIVPKTAWYNINGRVSWDTNTSGYRNLYIYVTGSAITSQVLTSVAMLSVNSGTREIVSSNEYLISGTAIVFSVLQNSAGTRTITSGRFSLLSY